VSTHAGPRRLTIAFLVGLILAALPATASEAARGVKISGETPNVTRGAVAFVDASIPARSRCRLEAPGVHTSPERIAGRHVRFTWRVLRHAAVGKITVAVRCARGAAALPRSHRMARTSISVAGTRSGGARLFKPSSVRIFTFRRRTAERFSRGRPQGVGDPRRVTFDAPRGTGGAGYGTFWPLNTGTRVMITQGQGGGVSHSSPYTRYAVDLGVPAGTEIRAGFSGAVARVSNTCRPGQFACGGGFGNYVLLKGADGTCALMAHLSRVDVGYGQQLTKYTRVGLSGYTGHIEPAGPRGAHLHYDRVVCATFRSQAWRPAEGGSLSQGSSITSQNRPDPVGCALLQGSCIDPQAGNFNPQGGTLNPQAGTPPDGSTGTGGAAPTPTPSPSQPQQSQPQTWSETTGGVTHTWTNYTNAGGTQGPSIPSNATVQIACKVQGFRVADGNTWWYRLASSPWNNQFFASADAFYNNGQTSGSLHGTPFVDPAVRDC
jgi:murein DD-endopeptidase MepM/ murein hydrolase activator NlpD